VSDVPAIVLTTQRLTLRRLTEDDAPLLFEMDSDPEVMRYLGPSGRTSVDDARQWIRELHAKYEDTNSRYGFFVAVETETGEFIGWFLLRPALDYRHAERVQLAKDERELGYRFRRLCCMNQVMAPRLVASHPTTRSSALPLPN
jgi:RimJ/RimL family protein N-acetyltransferase